MTILTRILGALAGIALLAFFAHAIFVEGKFPIASEGYYGPIMFPLGLYLAVAFISYGIGGQKLLRKIVPGLSEKAKIPTREESQDQIKEPAKDHQL